MAKVVHFEVPVEDTEGNVIGIFEPADQTGA